ncbi:hypothetical protein WA538_005925, partial [Blastocystis sp. DL]
MLERLSLMNDKVVTKSGRFDSLEHMEVPSDMIEFQQSVTHIDSFVHNASHYTIHYICSQSSPYPSVTLYRSTWPAVCLLFTLPMIPSCYYEEDEGKSFKIT